MNITRIPIAEAKVGDRVQFDASGDTAVITKIRRRRQENYLQVTMVDGAGTVYSRRYLDGTDGSPTNWTIDVLT